MPVGLLRCTVLAVWLGALMPAHAAPAASPPLPVEVEAALALAQVPPDAMVAYVQEVGIARPLLAWRPDEPVNPASLMKLVTTYAGLDLLGPAWTWSTPVWLQGAVHDGVLEGNLVIQGTGDPKWVLERVWLLLRRVQQLGVREIHGDIVLDRSAFSAPPQNPADFDGEPRRPYNVGADALLLNQKSVQLTFTPDPAHGLARVSTEPPLDSVDAGVPLSSGPCEDWRATLQPDTSDPLHTRFAGSYPLACGERQWALADADPGSYNERLLRHLWRELGGTLEGRVRDGLAPTTPPSFELASPAMAEVVRDINKFSNNVMAQQLFLTLGLNCRSEAPVKLGSAGNSTSGLLCTASQVLRSGLTLRASGTPQAARAVLRHWLVERVGRAADGVVIDNGSGLSREGRVSARLMARLLQSAWASPVMPELLASLPVPGLDGTLRKAHAAVGRAHLKTGSLRDVVGVAGYVLSRSGHRYAVVGIVNHTNSGQAWPALEALVDWVAGDGGARR